MSHSNDLPQPPVHPLDHSWYVYTNGASKGPMSGHEVRNLIQSGELPITSGVAKVGDDAWHEIKQHVFFGQFAASKAPHAPPPDSPYRPVTTRVAPVAEDQQVYAGFWIRLGAYLIDAVLVSAACYAMGFILGIILAILDSTNQAAIVSFVILSGLSVTFGYWALFTAGGWQATPGKRLMGIKVVRTDGGRVTVGLALGRALSYILSTIVFYVGFLMIGLTDQKKGLHDIICGTRVVYGKG